MEVMIPKEAEHHNPEQTPNTDDSHQLASSTNICQNGTNKHQTENGKYSMSFCEYHEFRAIDARLTYEQREELSALSSRAHVTSTTASYEYNYSSFPGDPYALVAECFDAMLFMASHGTRQLIFRFPLGTLDQNITSLFTIEDVIELDQTDTHLILNLLIDDEGHYSWIEGEGWLDQLVDLRRELLEGDFRCLYLFWLKFAEMEIPWRYHQESDEDGEERIEPFVPPGLQTLSPAQNTLVQFLDIDPYLIKAAALQSPRLTKPTGQQLTKYLPQLPDEEKLDFLERLSRQEPGLAFKLNDRLRKLSGQSTAPIQVPESNRSTRDLEQIADEIEEQEKIQASLVQEKKRQTYLLNLSKKENEIWEEIDELIQTKQSKKYDKATSLLVDLYDLADVDNESQSL